MCPLVVPWAMDFNTDHRCGGTTDPDMVLSSSLDLIVTMTTGDIVGHSDWHGLHSRVALKHQHGPRWPKPLASTLPLMVSVAMNRNTDSGCGTVMDPSMACSSFLGLDNTMAPGGTVDHSDRCDPGSSMVLRHKTVYRLQLRPWTTIWPFGTMGMDINTGPGCGRPWTQTRP